MNIITAQEMYDAVLTGINKEMTATLFPEEFNDLINKSQYEVIRTRYENVEQTQKRIDDLRSLIVLDERILNTGLPVAGGEIFLLPYDPNNFVITPKNPSGQNHGYMFMLRCSFKLNYVNNKCYTGISTEFLKSRIMNSDKLDEIKRDPFNKPKDDRLYYQITGDQFLIYTGTQSFGVEASIDYIRYPRAIDIISAPNVDCELPLHIRQEICEVAVRKYLENIESQRFQTNSIEQNKSVV